MCHWTGHSGRLSREFGDKARGKTAYAMEELVAELGSAFLCADLAITPELRSDHSAYIAIWLEVLKNDKRAIFRAAAHAQKATDLLHDFQPEHAPEPESMPAMEDHTAPSTVTQFGQSPEPF